MADKFPEFVQFGELTPAGKDLIAYMEAKIAETVHLYEEKGDINFINGMSGPLKHYHTWVQQLGSTTPEKFLEEFPYGASVMYENMQIEKQAAAVEKQNTETAAKTGDLEGKLAKMQEDLAAALGEIKTLREAAKVTVTVETDGDETPEVVQKSKAGKGRKSESEGAVPPAEPAAEEPEKPAEA